MSATRVPKYLQPPYYADLNQTIFKLAPGICSRAWSQAQAQRIDQAVERVLPVKNTNAKVHLLGVLHDMPGNAYCIAEACKALQPDVLMIERPREDEAELMRWCSKLDRTLVKLMRKRSASLAAVHCCLRIEEKQKLLQYVQNVTCMETVREQLSGVWLYGQVPHCEWLTAAWLAKAMNVPLVGIDVPHGSAEDQRATACIESSDVQHRELTCTLAGCAKLVDRQVLAAFAGWSAKLEQLGVMQQLECYELALHTQLYINHQILTDSIAPDLHATILEQTSIHGAVTPDEHFAMVGARDKYMGDMLQDVARQASRQLSGQPPVILAVVGRSHVRGLQRLLTGCDVKAEPAVQHVPE